MTSIHFLFWKRKLKILRNALEFLENLKVFFSYFIHRLILFQLLLILFDYLFIFINFFQSICTKLDIPQDYGGSNGSPESPEMHHCSSTTQPLGTPEVCLGNMSPINASLH